MDRQFLSRIVPLMVATLSLLLFAGSLLAAGELPSLPALQAKLSKNIPGFPKLDEVRATGMAGVYELRAGHSLYYSDAQGDYVLQGELVETRGALNLTRQRIDELTAVDFAQLPLKDAMVWKSGNGKRRMAVFADPNCPYCRKFEGEVQNLKDVTVYTFLFPALGGDSEQKAQNILCSKDPQQTWRSWMVKGVAIPPVAACDTAIDRNSAFAREHRIAGVPTLFFEDGSRIAGFVTVAQVEARLAGGDKPAGAKAAQ